MKTNYISRWSGQLALIGRGALLGAAFLVFSGCATTESQPPQLPQDKESSAAIFKEGVAGGVFVETMELNANVTAVDYENRVVTLLASDGEEFTVPVGPEAVNFDQIEVGDVVKTTLTEELVIGILPEHAAVPDGRAMKGLGYIETDEVEPLPDGTTGIVALAARGSRPGGIIASTTQVTATVLAINEENRTATLRTDDGGIEIFPVRDDIDLSQHKIGERVVFQTTEMIAISVEKR